MSDIPDTNDITVAKLAVAIEIFKKSTGNSSRSANKTLAEYAKEMTDLYIKIYKSVASEKPMED